MAARTRLVVAASLAAFIAVAWMPAAAAQPTTLYFHFGGPGAFDGIPLNLLPPPPAYRAASSAGPTGWTFTCAPATPGAPAQESHTFYGIAYAAPVEDGINQTLRLEARGLAYPAPLSGDVVLHWPLQSAVQASRPPVGNASVQGALANVVVRATLREGEDAAVGPDGFDAGRLLASGQSAPALLAGPYSQGVTVHDVDGIHVYAFTVPLQMPGGQALLTEAGFNLRVDVFVDNPACAAAGGAFMPPLVQVHSSDGLRPRLELEAQDVLRLGPVEATESDRGSIHLRAPVYSLWGPYAVAAANLTIRGDGGTPWPAVPSVTLVVPSSSEPNYRAGAPAYALASWAAATEQAPAGTYRLELQVSGPQGHVARGAVNVTLEESEKHPAPTTAPSASGAGAALVVALLAAVSIRRRRPPPAS